MSEETRDLVRRAVDQAFKIGMFQHRDEIEPLAAWVDQLRPTNVLEIGSWKGGTTYLWTQLAYRKVVSIDLPMGPFGGADAHMDDAACAARTATLRSCIGPDEDRLVYILANSQLAATRDAVIAALDGESFDFMFIDGDHTLSAIARDFELYYPLLASGGWIAFHDINDTPWHRQNGCEVDKFWASLTGEKREWNVHGYFGGIGAMRKAT